MLGFFSDSEEASKNNFLEYALFTKDKIKRGTALLFDWADEKSGFKQISVEESFQLKESQKSLFNKYCVNIDFDHLYGPIDENYVLGDSNFRNHSCDANLWIGEGNDAVIYARRN